MLIFFQFLYRFRVFILFLLLESIGFWLLVNSNPFQGAVYFNSSNAVTASILEVTNDVNGYFYLREVNEKLLEENRLLQLSKLNSKVLPNAMDTTNQDSLDFELISASVINKSLFFQNNYLTINKGRNQGVENGMGVIGADGIVGQVHTVSDNYASIFTLLHASILISSTHQNSGSLCTTKWDGKDPKYAKIEYLPRHINISIGDTITTSGYNAIFPKNTMIGVVDQVSIEDNATFYNIRIKNATDFYRISNVYLVQNNFKPAKDSLESTQQ